jgi:hypothetical protein
MSKTLEEEIALATKKQQRFAKKYVSSRLKGDRVLWEWDPFKKAKDYYPRTRKIYAATNKLTGEKVFIDPNTGQSIAIKTFDRTQANKAVDPVIVEKQLTAPAHISPSTRHKVTTNEISKTKQPSKPRIDQKTRWLRQYKKARIVSDVDLSKIDIDKMSARQIYEYNKHSHKRSVFLKGEESKLQAAIRGTKENNFTAISQYGPVKVNSRIYRRMLRAEDRRPPLQPKPLTGKSLFKSDLKMVWNAALTAGEIFKKVKGSAVAQSKKMWSSKWGRRGIKGVGGIVAFNLISGGLSKLLSPQRAIPDEYERGYDLISETFTDFGSPIKLQKAAAKVLRPYHSSQRTALNTTVESVINHNYALASSKRAIGHTRY